MAFTIPNEADAGFGDQAEPDSRDFADILAASLNLTGVVSGCAVTAQGTPDMTVAVASGTVTVAGTQASVTSGNLTIGTADGSNPRFDLICVNSSGTKSVVAGTAASNPVFPDPSGKVVLAAVYVPAGDTAINSNQIVDKRVVVKPWVQLAGDTMGGTLYQAGPVFDLGAYGAVGDGTTDDATAIDAALSAASSAGGGVVRGEIGKTYLTSGGHTIPLNTWLVDARFDHTGNNTCFTYSGIVSSTPGGEIRSGIDNVTIQGDSASNGNSGGSAIALDIQDAKRFAIRQMWIGGVNAGYSAGVGLRLNNKTANCFVESTDIDGLYVRYCATGILLTRSSGTASVSYQNWRAVQINVPASGIGIDFGGSGSAINAIFSHIEANIWLEGNSAIAVKVPSGSSVDETVCANIRIEADPSGAGYTGMNNVVNAGVFAPSGFFGTLTNSQDVTPNLAGATRTQLNGYRARYEYRLRALGTIWEPFPSEAAAVNGAPTSQVLIVAFGYFFAGEVLTGITLPLVSSGATVTYAKSCVYDTSGSLKASSADLNASIQGATGKVDMAFTSAYTVPVSGLLGCGFLLVGSGLPALPRATAGFATTLAARSGTLRRYAQQTGQATLPNPATFSNAGNGASFTFEVY